MINQNSKKAPSTYLLGEPPANLFPKRDIDLDWMTLVATSRLTFSKLLEQNNLAGLSGKMYPGFYPAETETTSPQSSKRWLTAGMACVGECWTLNILGSPNAAKGYSWLDTLEKTGDVPQRYYLSAKHLVTTLREAFKHKGVFLYVPSVMREMPTQEVLSWLKTLHSRGKATTRDLDMTGRTYTCED